MSERFMRTLFDSDAIAPGSFVVFVKATGKHIVANVLWGETNAGVANMFRQSTDIGAYAINVKPKVTP